MPERREKMKRTMAVLILLALICTAFLSCGPGASISIYAVRLDNQIKNLFLRCADMAAYRETITYWDENGKEAFSYSLYYERSEDIYSGYNICETIGNYSLYAYEGAVYTKDRSGITAVLLAGGTYGAYIDGYLTGAFPLDSDQLNQKSSESTADGFVAVYQAKATPVQASAASELGVVAGDTIEFRYTIEKTDGFSFIRSIEYSIIKAGETVSVPVAMRSFEILSDKENCFEAVKELTSAVSVNIAYVGEEKESRHFSVPSGVFVGIDTGTTAYGFFYDPECTQPYCYKDNQITKDLFLYAKAGK